MGALLRLADAARQHAQQCGGAVADPAGGDSRQFAVEPVVHRCGSRRVQCPLLRSGRPDAHPRARRGDFRARTRCLYDHRQRPEPAGGSLFEQRDRLAVRSRRAVYRSGHAADDGAGCVRPADACRARHRLHDRHDRPIWRVVDQAAAGRNRRHVRAVRCGSPDGRHAVAEGLYDQRPACADQFERHQCPDLPVRPQ